MGDKYSLKLLVDSKNKRIKSINMVIIRYEKAFKTGFMHQQPTLQSVCTKKNHLAPIWKIEGNELA
jgi:hypothetical protein